MTVVIDASAIVAALVDSGPAGRWAEALLASGLAAPHLLAVEVANVLRRAVNAGEITDDIASLAHADLLDLRVELVAYETVAARTWELRHNLTATTRGTSPWRNSWMPPRHDGPAPRQLARTDVQLSDTDRVGRPLRIRRPM